VRRSPANLLVVRSEGRNLVDLELPGNGSHHVLAEIALHQCNVNAVVPLAVMLKTATLC
jgi:hypothetical protein